MPKKRDSQATIQQILDVSQRLFSEKGYEKTSIQDILHDLNGLSKGAIYHHFASKEEILEAVITRMSEQSVQFLNKIRADSTMNGAQKLKAIFCGSIAQPIQDDLFQAAPRLYDDPFMLARMRDDSIHHVAPAYIAPLIREGVEDGSIVTGTRTNWRSCCCWPATFGSIRWQSRPTRIKLRAKRNCCKRCCASAAST